MVFRTERSHALDDTLKYISTAPVIITAICQRRLGSPKPLTLGLAVAKCRLRYKPSAAYTNLLFL